jgi:carbon-monoxide dehydrogenase large subunit
MAQTAPADVNAGRYGSGHSVRRIEDPALVAGAGRYVDDVSLPGQAHLVMLRSPYAHARIRSIDASAALAMPSVENSTSAPNAAATLNPPNG